MRRSTRNREAPASTPSAITSEIPALTCAASAGVHAGLVPTHLREAPQLGPSFIGAADLLLAVTAAVAFRPDDPRALSGAATLLAGLIASSAASRTAGIPVPRPRPEHVDALGLTTQAVAALGLACALRLAQATGGRRPPPTQEVAR